MVKEHYTVTHTMADGTKRDSIAGYVIPDDNPVYALFRKVNERRMEEMRKNGNQSATIDISKGCIGEDRRGNLIEQFEEAMK